MNVLHCISIGFLACSLVNIFGSMFLKGIAGSDILMINILVFIGVFSTCAYISFRQYTGAAT